jgi:hypothetical protein
MAMPLGEAVAAIGLAMFIGVLMGRFWGEIPRRFRQRFRRYIVKFDDGITVRVTASNATTAARKARGKWGPYQISEVYPEGEDE